MCSEQDLVMAFALGAAASIFGTVCGFVLFRVCMTIGRRQ